MTFNEYLEKFGAITRSEKKRVASFVSNLAKDSDKVIFDDKVRDVILKYARDEKLVRSVNKQLDEIEYAQSRKEAHKIDEMIELFCGQHASNKISNPLYRKALENFKSEVRRKAHLEALKYRSDSDIVDALPKTNTHAGQTGVLSGMSKKSDNLDNIFSRYEDEVTAASQRGTFGKLIFPAVRTQNGSPYDNLGNLLDELPPWSKTRMVAMIDLFIIIAERSFQKPVQWYLSNEDWYAGGTTPSTLRSNIHGWDSKYQNWISIDYSKYDSSLPGWLIRDGFSILKESFKGEFDAGLWSIIVHDFVNKAYLTTKGEVRIAHDGVPSGSMFTQVIDSVCNKLMIDTYMLSRNIKDYQMCVMGDDNIIFSNQEIDMKDLSYYINSMFGVKVNYKKSSTSKTCQYPEFLSREWRSLGEWREPKTLITKMLYPERFRHYSGEATPEMVVLSYCLSYPLGMAQLIRLDEFLDEINPRLECLTERSLQNLPGAMKFQMLYNGVQLDDSDEWFLVKQAALVSHQSSGLGWTLSTERTMAAA